jgi:sterol desaturase/sphingolipid hydroxylase (fatty acid hydroxylase superfamily)
VTAECIKTIAWSLGIVAALYPLEWLFPAEKGQPISKRFRNLLYMPFLIGFIYFTQPFANKFAGTILRAGSLLPAVLSPPSNGVAIALFALFFALVWDTWQYWVHRLQHTNKHLWETHKFHHSETALNATTHARTHIISHLLFLLLYTPMLLFLGSLSAHWIAALVMFRLWGYFLHANIRLNLGFLTPIISGPQWHRIHHSIQPEHRDKNFATFFPFLDIVFGTYYWPARDEYPETGLSDGSSVNFLQQATIEPFRVWTETMRTRRSAAVPERIEAGGRHQRMPTWQRGSLPPNGIRN